MSLPTIIPSHMRINGRIATSGDLIIEGRCAGTIEVGGTVTIAPGAQCEALIRARDARIDGHVAGTIVCRRAISVGPGAHIVGSLESPTVEVHPAARILGTGTPFDDPQRADLKETRASLAVTPAPVARPGKRVRVRGAGLRRPAPPPARTSAQASARTSTRADAHARTDVRGHQAEPQARTVPPLPRLPERVRVSRSPRRDPAGRRGAPK